MFNETNCQKDGTIRRQVMRPKSAAELIASAPHIYVANPLAKTPRENCKSKGDYDEHDLLDLPDDYLPRGIYQIADKRKASSQVPSFKEASIDSYYRLAVRNYVQPSNERTLIAAIIPPGTKHIYTIISIAFGNPDELLLASGLCFSIVADYIIRVAGISHIFESTIQMLPLPNNEVATDGLVDLIVARVLRLSCLTVAYAEFWEGQYRESFRHDLFTSNDARHSLWTACERKWNRAVAFRSPYERRQALLELDALSALSLGLAEEDLAQMYRVQFPVLRQYERANSYDGLGRCVPGEVIKIALQYNIDIHQPLNLAAFRGPAEVVGEVKTPGLGVTGGIVWEDPKMEPRMKRVYPPPFTKCDREADMRQAYRDFQERLRSQEDAP